MAQLNRQKEQRGPESEPRLADLRESGSIEQDADTVLMLHKPEHPDPERLVDQLQVSIEKQRNGPLGKVVLAHEKRFFKIANLELRKDVG